MRRMSDALFLNNKPDPDNVYAVRIKNGEFYMLALMENAEHYRIRQPKNYEQCRLLRDVVVSEGDLFAAFQNSDGYDTPSYLLYEMDDDGLVIRNEEKIFHTEYEEFLSLADCYTRDGVSDENDHDIFELSKDELSAISDALRDGDYIFIIQ